MKIRNHKLSAPASHKNQSPNKNGKIKPSIIVLHYTASGGEDGSGDASYLSRAQSRASAQVVVGRAGDVHQLMALNERAWHAGKSNYKGNTDVNSIGIGIEIDNWGYLDTDGKSHAGTKVPKEFQFEGTRNGHSLWEAYRDEQLQAVEKVIAAICDSYDIVDIVGHEDVSPGRKQDPGPALDEFKGLMKQKYLKDVPAPAPKAKGGLTTKVNLNLRARPNHNAVVLTVMAKGSSVEFIEETYPGWFKLRFGNRVGWAVGKYIR